jgi:hypothetical protein
MRKFNRQAVRNAKKIFRGKSFRPGFAGGN